MNTPTRANVSGAPEAARTPMARHETIEALLASSGRCAVPIRHWFVQQGPRGAVRPGPLAEFLTNRDGRALDAYLLIHALASAAPWNCDFPSGFWVRALGLADGRDFDGAKGTVSKIMRRLCDRNLVSRRRAGRCASITLLREDGTGAPYRHPFDTHETWLRLPHAYWHDRHYVDWSLRAKVMLLIALSLPKTFYLPHDKAPSWYGISADSADRGLRELHTAGVLVSTYEWMNAPRSDTGWARRVTYKLVGPYSKSARTATDGSERAEHLENA